MELNEIITAAAEKMVKDAIEAHFEHAKRGSLINFNDENIRAMLDEAVKEELKKQLPDFKKKIIDLLSKMELTIYGQPSFELRLKENKDASL